MGNAVDPGTPSSIYTRAALSTNRPALEPYWIMVWHPRRIAKSGELVPRKNDTPLVSLGVDAWGVDFGLIGSGGELLGLPHCYRDPAHDAAFDRLMHDPGGEVIYDATGIQTLRPEYTFSRWARAPINPHQNLLEQAEALLFHA